jgi:hypothetical protein
MMFNVFFVHVAWRGCLALEKMFNALFFFEYDFF